MNGVYRRLSATQPAGRDAGQGPRSPTETGSRKARCAVIGAGWWGTWAHVPALKNHPDAELIAIQHHDPDQARRIAADFEVPHACTTAEEILAIEDLDAVVVSSTPDLHFPQAKAALERGLHVLVEKPMTHTVAQAEELMAVASRHKVELLVGTTFHYNRHANEAKSLIQSGAIGDPKLICILFMDEILGLYQGLSWDDFAADHPDPEVKANPYMAPGQRSYSDPTIAGGGQLSTQVSHPAALLAFLTEDRPIEVHGLLDNNGTAVDVFDAVTVKMARGTAVSIASGGSIGNGPRHFDVRIYGTRGVIEMELLRGSLKVWRFGEGATEYPSLDTDEALYPRFDPARNLVEVALASAPNRSPATYGLAAMRIIEGARESAQTGRVARYDGGD